MSEVDDLLFRAEELRLLGKKEAAAEILGKLVCSHADPAVRERAGALFHKNSGITLSALESSPASSAAAETERKAPPVPEENGVDAEFVRSLQARRAERLADVFVPLRATLPTPLLPFIRRYLKQSIRAVPSAEVMALVTDCEAALLRLPAEKKKADVCACLESLLPRFTGKPFGTDVFCAIVNTCYVNDWLSIEGVQRLSASSGLPDSAGRTIRELLMSDE